MRWKHVEDDRQYRASYKESGNANCKRTLSENKNGDQQRYLKYHSDPSPPDRIKQPNRAVLRKPAFADGLVTNFRECRR